MNFAKIQRKARAVWDGFESGDRARVKVGAGTCGKAAGAVEVIDALRGELAKAKIDAEISEVGCLGLCYAEPLLEFCKPGAPRLLYGGVTPENVSALVKAYFLDDDLSAGPPLAAMNGSPAGDIPAFADLPMVRGQARLVMRNCGVIAPDNVDHYIARGGYQGLANALRMSPDEVIEEVKRSGLRGRGGAGFPTGVKWGFCRRSPGAEKYMICNADEGDPGAFMDRSVIESDPHSVLEGMAIAAYAIGAEHGYVYARAEYPLAIERLEGAMAQAEDMGLLGDDMMGSGHTFHVKLKKGAGAFVCGEETALIASIEGRRGMPWPRPPFPAQKGLRGKPSNINNVETLANTPVILEKGADWFARFGTETSRGAKTFALAGKITRTGLIEVPMGIPLRRIVEEIGGGVPDGKRLRAVQTGGPSGGCLPADMLDLEVDYETLARAGSIMGSGGMVVMDEDTCMVDIARYFLQFTESESCGKCAPCRLGTRHMRRILDRITSGLGKSEDIDLLEEIGESLKEGALCALGQTAPNPVLTTIRYFRDEYEAHIRDGRCPAGVCRPLLHFSIDPKKCICCGRCSRDCPSNCITGKKGKAPAKATEQDKAKGKVGEPYKIDQDACIKCGNCFEACPVGAVART